jgi:hypothetical protein
MACRAFKSQPRLKTKDWGRPTATHAVNRAENAAELSALEEAGRRRSRLEGVDPLQPSTSDQLIDLRRTVGTHLHARIPEMPLSGLR